MGLINEFKQFIRRGNVLDLAVGVVIGAAFGKIVSSLVSDLFMPMLGVLIGGIDFKGLKLRIGGTPEAPVMLNYGNFMQATFDFLIIAFAIFLMVKAINRMKRKEEEKPKPPPVPTREETLLEEIRDLLKQRTDV